MKTCQEHAPLSQTRAKIVRAGNATVRDAIDHLRDDGMTAMARAVEKLLTKCEYQEIQNVEPKRIPQSAR